MDSELEAKIDSWISEIDKFPMQHEYIYMNLKTMQKLLKYQVFNKIFGEVIMFGKVVKNDETLKDGEVLFGKKVSLYEPEQEIEIDVEIK